ncbi:hypothetical protein SMACR_05313 [Sordaria macrospora]|uniref:WGS project CABT00000000 data, contig 2.25 n=2 Tax=Sordaria macrospora TaxID=5147 RepID=F7W3T1_SORMK|nr:uncharacterized protein SMAC_05313 [Sordaria macrospora k-hell]KAA8633851.1 hypothetical protein SMACR_05313 [Sordaria macrospora]WPJ63344.1 hypothetical protein SMAC4_05313 [Sordaria macrospora]CCC12240.1 unnamed protein product [Sordaria macrospora k-hell]
MVDCHAALEGSDKYLCSRSHCLGLEKLEIPSPVSQNIDLLDAEILLKCTSPSRAPHDDPIRPVTLEFELSASSNSTYYKRLSPCYIKIRSDDLGRLGVPEDFGSRPPAPTQTQIPLIKKWLARCPEEHGPLCDTSMFQPSQSRSLLVVDVKNGCLVDLPPSTSRRYFALSYVWGQAATFQTVLDNVDSLRQSGGIDAVRHLLPKTITDAMDLLVALDEQYLWCDRLCIVQDDAMNKHSLISRMDEVYATAFAVIMARSGSNAEAGLFAERHPWHTEEGISDNLRLVAIPLADREEEYGMAPLEALVDDSHTPDGAGNNGIDTWSSTLYSEFQRYCGGHSILQRHITSPQDDPALSLIPLKAGTLRFYTLCASFEVSPCEEQYYSTKVQLPDASGI